MIWVKFDRDNPKNTHEDDVLEYNIKAKIEAPHVILNFQEESCQTPSTMIKFSIPWKLEIRQLELEIADWMNNFYRLSHMYKLFIGTIAL